MRLKALIGFAVLGVTLLTWTSCSKSSEDPIDLRQYHKFMPLEVGKYILYNVDSIIYDDVNEMDIHKTSQVRYDFVDTFHQDIEGKIVSYVVNVRQRNSATDPFYPVNVIYYTPSEDKIVLYDQNLKFINLSFPIENGKSWNGTAMINTSDNDNYEYNSDAWNYVYSKYGSAFDAGLITFNNCVVVDQIEDTLNFDPLTSTVKDTVSFGFRNYGQEVYAYNVGMVYKERIFWEYQPNHQKQSGYRKGYSVVMKAVEHN